MNGFQTRPLENDPDSRRRADKSTREESARQYGIKARRQIPRPPYKSQKSSGAIKQAAAHLYKNRPRNRREWKRFFIKSVVGFIAFLILYFLFIWITLPDIQDPKSFLASQSTIITDREGVELYRLFSEEDRTYVESDQIPTVMKQASISIEDERFYERGCLDMRAIARAVLLLGRAGGGSTITRQLARNALNLFEDNRYQRKIKEVILGCQLEHKFEKDDLLVLYLNWIPFGHNAYGVEQASQVYFGISAQDLSLDQAVVLASLPQRPTYFSPYGRHLYTEVTDEMHQKVIDGSITRSTQVPNESVTIGLLGSYIGTGSTTLYIGGRTDQVLQNMQEQGYITEQEKLKALGEIEMMEFQPSRESIRAPHFVLWVREEIEQMFAGSAEEGLFEQGGLTIETTLDWDLQQAAEEVIEFHREDILTRYGAYNMALVTIDPDTREVLAYVGNMDYSDEEHGGKIDMALAPRQPGSSFKPFVYAAAFDQGYSPATVLFDVPTKIGDNEPQNFDGEFKGLMTMRQALGASRNIPAAKAFFLAGGEDRILNLVEDMGAPSPKQRRQELNEERPDGFDYGWPLALGAAETPLFEMTQAYTTFAADGEYSPPIRIRRITDKKGNILFEADLEEKPIPVIDPRIAYQITSVLSDEWARPEEYWKTQLTVPGYQTAAKTGTSNKCLEWKDEDTCLLRKPDNAWLLGYTPHLVTGVWVGNADSSSMFDKGGGLNTASPIWRDYMMRAHRLIEKDGEVFEVPEGVVQPQVSLLSGELPAKCTPVNLRRADVFLEENAPTKMDPGCKELIVDKLTHLLASDKCPVEAQEAGSFLAARSILPDRWPLWEEGVQAWIANQMEKWYADETHSGAIIPLPIAPTEECDPALTPGRLVLPELSITYPQAGGIASYPAFRPKIDVNVGSNVREVIYKVDGKQVASYTQAPFDNAMRVPRSVAESGVHSLSVTLIDEYFNEVTKSVSFRFDEDKRDPIIRLIKPSKDISIKSEQEVSMLAEASDPDGAIKFVQFYLGDTLLSTKPKEPYELTYMIGLPDGVYILRAVAEDLAKNKAEDSIKITIGDGGPAPVTPSAAEPRMLEPPESLLDIRINEVVDIRVDVPALGGDLNRIRIIIESNVLVEDEVLLDLSDGQGIYVRPWKAERPGTYTIRLVTENRNGVEEEWVTRTVDVH
ncbi:MAG: transglycosylase domain-containing protein [Kiritimatiellales bacterium]|nr:transglycosylase domain-containing protein [Kiritimatiellales bacterium]